MTYEVDFHPIEKTGEAGSKSGDAISVQFTDAAGLKRVIVIDGGYKHTGEAVVEHVEKHYGTTTVDLVISTHPDMDHINGLATVLDQMTVGELIIHRPHDHAPDVSEYSQIEVIDALIGLAEDRNVTVTEPFAGLTRFGGAVRVLGPTIDFYEDLLAQDLSKSIEEKAALSASGGLWQGAVFAKAADLLDRVISALPIETLGEGGVTSPRNNTSVVTLLTLDGRQLMLTGDAGIDALNLACDEYENRVGDLSLYPLTFFQAPHHGSRRNLAPSVLNRILGKPGANFGTPTSFISSAKADPKHPSPKVTNALKRRGARVFATEGNQLMHHYGSTRGWGPATEVPPLVEDDN